MCGILGLFQEGYFERKKERWLKKGVASAAEIEALIGQRNLARKQKNWPEADRIRAQLQNQGIVIEDTPAGTIWKVK